MLLRTRLPPDTPEQYEKDFGAIGHLLCTKVSQMRQAFNAIKKPSTLTVRTVTGVLTPGVTTPTTPTIPGVSPVKTVTPTTPGAFTIALSGLKVGLPTTPRSSNPTTPTSVGTASLGGLVSTGLTGTSAVKQGTASPGTPQTTLPGVTSTSHTTPGGSVT